MTTSKTYAPTHGGYPGVVPAPKGQALNLRKDPSYRVRAYGRLWPDTPVMVSVVGTESETVVQALAEARPETIYFVTEEAFA